MFDKKNNLEIWDQVQTTPKGVTSEVVKDQVKLTSPNPMHLIKIATKIFGPMGIGWGVESIESKTETIGPENVYVSEHVRLWYVHNGKRGEVSHWSTMPYAYRTNRGEGYFKIDEEARKKCRTNATSKCLSLLGFSADIWLKYYNSPAYLEARTKEQERENKALAIKEQYLAIMQNLDHNCLSETDEDRETLCQWVLDDPGLTLDAMQVTPGLSERVKHAFRTKGESEGIEPHEMLKPAWKWKLRCTGEVVT